MGCLDAARWVQKRMSPYLVLVRPPPPSHMLALFAWSRLRGASAGE